MILYSLAFLQEKEHKNFLENFIKLGQMDYGNLC